MCIDRKEDTRKEVFFPVLFVSPRAVLPISDRFIKFA